MPFINCRREEHHTACKTLLNGVEQLPHPYLLFDDKGDVQYANLAAIDIFGQDLTDKSVYIFLKQRLDICNVVKKLQGDTRQCFTVGIFDRGQGLSPLALRLTGTSIAGDGERLHQCLLTQIRPVSALQIGLKDIEKQDRRKVAQFVGSIAVEVDQEETGLHLLRTGLHAHHLTRIMHRTGKWPMIDDAFSDAVGLYSMLHDIGKVYVPRSILHKKERLSELEWNIVKGHILSGLNISEILALPAVAREIIGYHHTRWDGLQDTWDSANNVRHATRGGYPFSAKGQAIPLSARIFAYVDVFDALTSARSYKPAWSADQAVDYILHELVGTQLDPNIMPLFLDSLDSHDTSLAHAYMQ